MVPVVMITNKLIVGHELSTVGVDSHRNIETQSNNGFKLAAHDRYGYFNL